MEPKTDLLVSNFGTTAKSHEANVFIEARDLSLPKNIGIKIFEKTRTLTPCLLESAGCAILSWLLLFDVPV